MFDPPDPMPGAIELSDFAALPAIGAPHQLIPAGERLRQAGLAA